MKTITEYRDSDGWWVVDTGITKDEWVELLRNDTIIKPVYLEWILRFYGENENQSSCYLLGKKYSTNPQTINAYLTSCAKAIQRFLNRFTIQNVDVEGDHFMTILMKGKSGGKDGYILKLREELCEAIHEFLITTLLDEFAAIVRPIGLSKKGIDELYKWQIVTDCANKTNEQILRRLLGTNLIDNRFDGAAIKSLLTTEPESISKCFNILRGAPEDLQNRYKAFKEVTDALTNNRWKYIISDERMAASFLACADPTHYTFYKNDAYSSLCNYLRIPTAPAKEKMTHFYQLLNEILSYYHQSDLVHFFKKETEGYVQSDLLSVQTIVWYMQDFMNNRFNAKTEFTWVPFISELAHKLLEYRNKRKELLRIFYEIDRQLTTAYREEGEDITDITPFTVLGTLAVGKKERRSKFAKYYKEQFGLKTEIPTDYTGFPSLNAQRVMFIFGKDKASYTEPHWNLFEAALSNKDISEFFDQVMAIKGSRRNISMGLFWINPTKFLSLDSTNEAYLVHYGFPSVPSDKNKITYDYYNQLMTEVSQKMESGEIEEKDFLEFSAAAYANKYDNDEETDENNNDMETTYYDTIVSALKEKKNIILQGAPGTGKTYAIPEVVTRLCRESIDYSDRSEVMKAYSRLVAEKRVVFTTFHQSMDYEDFVEGLKPTVDEQEKISYTVQDGIFKTICEDASKPIIKNNSIALNSDATIWKVSLARTYENEVRTECLNNGHIRIGWDEYGEDYQDQDSFETGGRIILDAFYNKMEEGDIIFSCYTQKLIDAIGIVEGDVEWHDEYDEYKRLRKVRWLVKNIKEDITSITGKKMTLGTVYRLNDVSIDDVLTILKKYSAAGSASTEKNQNPYVIVIDEINRGNVSKIFGELITLLEADKRSDGSMPLKVKLPYSKTDFSIPSNLYLIGTMNTADRSLTQFDYAMRRRFRFITMAYNYVELNLPEDKTFEEELFDKVSALFIKNLDEYKENPDVKIVPADCFSPEFKPIDLWIGPSYFITDNNDEYGLYNNVFYEIIPTLEHYIEDGVFVDEDPVNKVIEELKSVFED